MTEFQSLDKWFGQSKWLMALLLLNNLKKYVLLLSLVSIVIIIKKNNYSTIKDYRVKLLIYLVTKNLIIHFKY